MKAVYVAGAYSAPDVMNMLANMDRGIELATECLEAGFAPFAPWLDFLFCIRGRRFTKQQLYAYSLEWLRRADAVIVVEEGWELSRGTLVEIEEARRLGNPVFWSLAELRTWARGNA